MNFALHLRELCVCLRASFCCFGIMCVAGRGGAKLRLLFAHRPRTPLVIPNHSPHTAYTHIFSCSLSGNVSGGKNPAHHPQPLLPATYIHIFSRFSSYNVCVCGRGGRGGSVTTVLSARPRTPLFISGGPTPPPCHQYTHTHLQPPLFP